MIQRYGGFVNLVAADSTLITVSTCIVGLLLILPRTNVVNSVRYVVFAMRQRHKTQSEPPMKSNTVDTPEPSRELVDA